MSKIDLSDMLPPGSRKAPAKKLNLGEFLDNGPPPEPEIFSPPQALELHLCRTRCKCGEIFISPEGTFVEVTYKQLRTIGLRHYYKEIGQVLIPISAQRSEELAAVPHRIRTREAFTLVCHLCIDRADLYETPKPQSHHEWEIRRPPLYTQAWLSWQMESAPTKAKLHELIEQIERREALKDDEKFQPGKVDRILHQMLDKSVDPEKQWEE